MFTREDKNAQKIADAVSSVGLAITVLEHLWETLAAHLPEDFPTHDATQNLKAAHDQLKDELLGV